MIKMPDLEKEQSEFQHTLIEFRDEYNKGIPEGFPRADISHLTEFQSQHPKLFKKKGQWTLAEHRKKFMDWLPQYIKELENISVAK